MTDYKELLRRAVEALPENNGAARRAVYEKARSALVGQLRAINPPLPARDITTHRLQLEDCIRQVEQEASEANIAGLNQQDQSPPTLPPVFASEPRKPTPRAAITAEPAPRAPQPKATPRAEPPKAQPKFEPAAKGKVANGAASIEDIIAAAEEDQDEAHEPVPVKAPEIKSRPPKSQPVLVAKSDAPSRERDEPRAKPEQRQLPSIVARAEAAKGRPVTPGFGVAIENGRRGPTIEPRRSDRSVAAAARQMEPMEFDVPEDVQAMAAVREVEVEQPADPQGAIDRAIATLDREARGDNRPAHFADTEVELDDEPEARPVRNGLFNGRANGNSRPTGTDLVVSRAEPREMRSDLRAEPREMKAPRPAKEFANPRRAQAARAFDGVVPRAQSERGGMGAVSIFLIIFAALLVGAGGASFWAYQEGYIDLDAMFGRGTPVVSTAATNEPVVTADSTGPGNTETPAANEPTTELRANERLATDVASTSVPAESVAPLALQSPTTGDAKTEERLGSTSTSPETAEQAVAAVDPMAAAGSQSLLLEASDNGTTGAVPFSGTVDWSRGTDETGQPTLVGKANIPARNLSVEVLIRKNSDTSLPASHLMEINFTVSETFIGGSIAGLPGVLLKNEELSQGLPLIGASARVVGNSFLFALSATPADSTANTSLLTSRKWMDLALIYASGKRAIITLEKDGAAEKLFSEVFAAWGTAPASAG
ncbi:MAG: hypothetical protein EOP22_15455 [Hyphomicrobiales bacterium]|nr:MAG: hypothetical protein EOP22_15455 [Hyphomicrobiales bacterium]